MARVWAGVDAGKTHHHCVVIDGDGKKLLSRRVANDEPDLLALIGDVTALAGEVTWAVDLPDEIEPYVLDFYERWTEAPVAPGPSYNTTTGPITDRAS